MVDSVNAFILAERRVTVKDISEQLQISGSTAPKIVYDDLFYVLLSFGSPNVDAKEQRAKLFQLCLSCFTKGGHHLSFTPLV